MEKQYGMYTWLVCARVQLDYFPLLVHFARELQVKRNLSSCASVYKSKRTLEFSSMYYYFVIILKTIKSLLFHPGTGLPATPGGGVSVLPNPTQVEVMADPVSVCHQLSRTGALKAFLAQLLVS